MVLQLKKIPIKKCHKRFNNIELIKFDGQRFLLRVHHLHSIQRPFALASHSIPNGWLLLCENLPSPIGSNQRFTVLCSDTCS